MRFPGTRSMLPVEGATGSHWWFETVALRPACVSKGFCLKLPMTKRHVAAKFGGFFLLVLIPVLVNSPPPPPPPSQWLTRITTSADVAHVSVSRGKWTQRASLQGAAPGARFTISQISQRFILKLRWRCQLHTEMQTKEINNDASSAVFLSCRQFVLVHVFLGT